MESTPTAAPTFTQTPLLDAARLRSLAEHRRVFRAPPLLTAKPVESLIAAVDRSGLRGRGGAGFPAATKLSAVANAAGSGIVVVNGGEGEPLSDKDKFLMTKAPHLVLDGAILAAVAVGANEVIVCVDQTFSSSGRALRAALDERISAGEDANVRLQAMPNRYVAGEASATVNFLNKGEALPTLRPPRMAERGVDKRPTLVDNVETMAHLATIARFGPAWFRQRGTAEAPGTLLVTLAGAVSAPGVYEFSNGARLHAVLQASGASPTASAVLLGGYFGTWMSIEETRLARLDDSLQVFGASVGCGVIAVLDNGCGVGESATILQWMAGQSAGQCGPCVNGLGAIARTAVDIATGNGTEHSVAWLQRWAAQVDGRGACNLPDGAVGFLRSALRVFATEYAQHSNGRVCSHNHTMRLFDSRSAS